MNRLVTKLTIFCISLIFVSLMFASQIYAEIDMQNCIGAWLFDEGSGDVATDSSETNEDSPTNGAEWVDRKSGKALSFDGVSNFVEIADIPALNPKEAMSMACWVYLTGKSGQHRDILSKDGETAARQYLITASDANGFRAHIWTADGVANYFDGNTVVELETWYHIAQTYDGDKLTLYVNGEEDGSINLSGDIIVTDQPVRIGGGALAGGDPLHTQGIIDDVVIFNVALEQEDIQTLMNQGLSFVLAVSSEDKIATTWSSIKAH